MKQKEHAFLVLDQGSSGSRALLVNRAGHITVKKHREITAKHLGLNSAEYDGKELLDSQLGALHDALGAAGGKNISSIAVVSQRSTIVLWDKTTGVPVAPVLTWQDGRAHQISANVQIPQEEIHAKTGLYKTPFYSASKITWCLENIEAAKKCAAAGNLLAGPVATYIIWHLTGGRVFAADQTLAQRTLLFNINTFDWDEDLLKAFSVKREWLPEIKNTLDNYGMYKDTPIKICAGDQQTAATGLGISREGDTAINYGTGAFLLTSTGGNLKSMPGILTSVGVTTARENKNFLLEGPVNAAGGVFQWLKQIGINFNIKDIDDMAARAKNPVWFLPAFGGIGAPYWDFDTQTVISGLTTSTKKEDFIAGAVRSLAFMTADIFFYLKNAGIKTGETRVSGGFAKNLSLLQFQSDILQSMLMQNSENDTTALGAAFLMARETGADTTMWEVFNSVRTFTPQMPSAEAAALYQQWRKFFDWCRSYK
ncbi:MAG: FGGY family carbohydrate kinase [Elusimicrobia bacterium]|nr:FGGY family carbohydrate kinase [Elusimicrobiota bacterium]